MAEVRIDRLDAHTLAFTGLSEDQVRTSVRFGANAEEEPVAVHAEADRIVVRHREPGPLRFWM